MDYLFKKSIEILEKYQRPSGAFIASSNFKVYKNCWLGDGTYAAYAPDLVGNHTNAERFYLWCAEAIERYREKIECVEEKLQIWDHFCYDCWEEYGDKIHYL